MTVRQLLQKDSNSNDLNGSRWKIPRVEIRDEPALHWRGLMFFGQCSSRSFIMNIANLRLSWAIVRRVPKVLLVAVPIHRLDVSRHFFCPADVKHLLRTMALFKMNHFHWHLTDDQGWRFPVAKYPNLIRLGAFRRASPLGHTDRTDNTPYNHSYTELEIEDVISFAESLYIQAPWGQNWQHLDGIYMNLHEFAVYTVIYPQILDDYRSRQGRVRRLHLFI